MNFSHCEVARLKCDAKKKCQRMIVIPRIDTEKLNNFHEQLMNSNNWKSNPNLKTIYHKFPSCRRKTSDVDKGSHHMRECLRNIVNQPSYNGEEEQISIGNTLFKAVLDDQDFTSPPELPKALSKIEFLKRFPELSGLSDEEIEKKIEGLRFTEFKYKYPKYENDNPGEILDELSMKAVKINYKNRLEEVSKSMRPGFNNAFVISGHSIGDSVWGGEIDGPFNLKLDFDEIGESIDNRDIESLFFAACSTGGDKALKNEMKICNVPPGRIYGIDGTSPSNSSHSGRGLADLMALDDKIANDANNEQMIQRLIKSSVLINENPVLLMCSNNKYKTFTNFGAFDFDPNAECGVNSAKLKKCLNKLLLGPKPLSEKELDEIIKRGSNSAEEMGLSANSSAGMKEIFVTLQFQMNYDIPLEDVEKIKNVEDIKKYVKAKFNHIDDCEFTPSDRGFAQYEEYLKPNLELAKRMFPATRYLGPAQNLGEGRNYGEDYDDKDYEDITQGKDFFKILYRMAQADFSCVKNLDFTLFNSESALLSMWHENDLKNIHQSVLNRFAPELGENGIYNKILKRVSELECFEDDVPLIGEETFSSRRGVAKFIAKAQIFNEDILNCEDSDLLKKAEQVNQLATKILYRYIMRGDVEITGDENELCRPDGIIYNFRQGEGFEWDDQYLEKFQKDRKAEEIECLTGMAPSFLDEY